MRHERKTPKTRKAAASSGMRMIAAAVALVGAAPLCAAADPGRFMPAELIAETPSPSPGSTILVGFRMTPKPGWHGYWSNPGDSGIAPSVTWSAPKTIRFGPLLHPAPTLLTASGISSFVHEGPHILLSRMTIPRAIAPGTPIPIEATLSWAACTATQCVPLHATLKLELVAGDGTAGPDSTAVELAARKLPKIGEAGSYTAAGTKRLLVLPASIELSRRDARFYPDDNDAFAAASGHAVMEGTSLVIRGVARKAPSGPITGVVSDGRRSWRLGFNRREDVSAPSPTHLARPKASSSASSSLSRSVANADEANVTRASRGEGRSAWPPLAAIGILATGAIALALHLASRR